MGQKLGSILDGWWVSHEAAVKLLVGVAVPEGLSGLEIVHPI